MRPPLTTITPPRGDRNTLVLGLATFKLIVVSCFSTKQDPVDSALRQFWEDRRSHFEKKVGKLDFAHIYEGLPPAGGAHPKRVLVFTPRIAKDCCVLVANLEDGWQSLGFVITSRIGGQCHQFGLSSDDLEYPAYSFTLISGGKELRHVSALKDAQWEFYEEGVPLSQEDTALYRNRRIKDRLTNDYTCRLAAACGYDIANDQFWRSEREAFYYHEVR